MFLILNVSHESISLALYYNSYYILGEGSMNENSDSDMIIYNIQFKNMKKKKSQLLSGFPPPWKILVNLHKIKEIIKRSKFQSSLFFHI